MVDEVQKKMLEEKGSDFLHYAEDNGVGAVFWYSKGPNGSHGITGNPALVLEGPLQILHTIITEYIKPEDKEMIRNAIEDCLEYSFSELEKNKDLTTHDSHMELTPKEMVEELIKLLKEVREEDEASN